MTAVVRARHADRTVTAEVSTGLTLRQALDPSELRVRTGCNGNGSCGLCRVRILSGTVSPPTDEERLNLGQALLGAGVRLACRTMLEGEVEVEVVNLAPRSGWRSIPLESLRSPRLPRASRRVVESSTASRIALDVGTTNLCLSFWNAESSHRLAARRGLNPQSSFGADVVTRLQAARDPAVAGELARAVKQACMSAIRAVACSDGISVMPYSTVVAVGNSAMLQLLQASEGGLLDPTFWSGPALWPADGQLVLVWDLESGRQAKVELVRPLGGFVGSDLLAAALAADLLGGECPALLLDFGTNTEIALWDGVRLWVTSAAGGPAFESSGMRYAMPADLGAVYRVKPGMPLGFEVIGGGEPEGVCGSGLVDWIACLLDRGTLSRRGTFADRGTETPPALCGEQNEVFLSKRDVDVFQRAKAAIGAGIRLLGQRAGINCDNLRRVVSTGLFGSALDVANAQAIGLLPVVAPERVETYDNLALAGCEMMLQSPEGLRGVEPLRARAKLVNLAQCPEFEEMFVQGLFLEPMEA